MTKMPRGYWQDMTTAESTGLTHSLDPRIIAGHRPGKPSLGGCPRQSPRAIALRRLCAPAHWKERPEH